MTGLFEPAPGGAAITLDETTVVVLRHYFAQMVDLIGGDDPAPVADSAEALVGSAFADGPSKPPDNPILARLFPDAYGDFGQDPNHADLAASAEFRRYTENDLRARKRADALAVLATLEPLAPTGDDEVEVRLDGDGSRHWLGALNDLRLAVGTRLKITDDREHDEYLDLPDDDPRQSMARVYLWLGSLQETLIDCLE
ncbi:MAG TPA: DUF2017 domain-containing protein [Stackebrandtia sp.]|jgi:hypothetical protein|uniref:DUF2017 domain-containing protein n=1 Tax=Stackebrandtia sp. TaxID=2023065 RepID=UPI002D5FC7C6|nr:DUF2017 domain-containing protein [Stackebrandtia sp.]HZE38773.1 DUF2017 domain-containing protein [Stackebrandtia sp.]